MIRGLVIRETAPQDREAVRALLTRAFDGPAEARLVEALREADDVALELVATHETVPVGHAMFSRLIVERAEGSWRALALAPLAVEPAHQRTGIGTVLVENAHHVLQERGETLSVVLGDPAYYGRFGYSHARAAGFESVWQGPALQALAWQEEAPSAGRLVYPRAFSGL